MQANDSFTAKTEALLRPAGHKAPHRAEVQRGRTGLFYQNYMIKETTKKIHWTPYEAKKGREADTNPAPVVTVNRKFGYMTFGKKAITEMGAEGCFIKFYFEPVKKIIGWQLRKMVNQSEMKSWKLVKSHPKSGSYKASINKLLMQFNGRLGKESYQDLPVQKYREIAPISEYKDQVFYFVELVDDTEELKKGVGDGTE